MATINRNGKSYGSADVSIALLGSIDYEITKLEYSVSQDHTANYSAGSANPTSYSMGKKDYKCTLGLRMKSFVAIVIQNIAMQCGCGSIQTFYRYFKLFYNETPTQWIERNK